MFACNTVCACVYVWENSCTLCVLWTHLCTYHLCMHLCHLCLYSLMFSPIYDTFHCRNFTNSHCSLLENPPLITLLCWSVLLCIAVYLFISIYIFVGVHTNIANIITNILITNIIIQIPEGNYLTCMPPLPPSFLWLSSKSSHFSPGHRRRKHLA